MSIEEVKQEVNQELVEMLEDLLSKAKAAELQSAAICGCASNGCTFNCFSAGPHTMALLGEIAVMMRDYQDLNIQLRRVPLWDCCE